MWLVMQNVYLPVFLMQALNLNISGKFMLTLSLITANTDAFPVDKPRTVCQWCSWTPTQGFASESLWRTFCGPMRSIVVHLYSYYGVGWLDTGLWKGFISFALWIQRCSPKVFYFQTEINYFKSHQLKLLVQRLYFQTLSPVIYISVEELGSGLCGRAVVWGLQMPALFSGELCSMCIDKL